MRQMKKGDLGFFYHSGDERCAVGIVKVVAEVHPDSTDGTGTWECVDVGR
jgi:predicted RNA-binding protein with PUA-like domain